MNRQNTTSDDMVELADEDLRRFHKNAPAALARRGGGFVAETVTEGLQTIIGGAIPIVGMLWWDWSALTMLVFLLAGLWLGILADSLKLTYLRRQVTAFAEARYDDWHVWVVVGALRSKDRKAPAAHLSAKWDPRGGLVVDFIFGTVSTLLILAMLYLSDKVDFTDLRSPGFLFALLATAVLRVTSTTWEILHHQPGEHKSQVKKRESAAEADRPVSASPGLRGAGLFLLMFLVLVTVDKMQDGSRALEWVMLIVNGCVVAYGVLNASGPLWLRGETRWLREYLQERHEANEKR